MLSDPSVMVINFYSLSVIKFSVLYLLTPYGPWDRPGQLIEGTILVLRLGE